MLSSIKDMEPVRLSKSSCYERPYVVKGSIKQAGSKGKPKGICKDRDNGTGKAGHVEALLPMKR